MASKRKYIQLLLKWLLIIGTVSSMTITFLLLFRDYANIDKEAIHMSRISFRNNRFVALDTNYFESAKIISSVNTILRESVSLFCLIGGLKENHYLTQTSGISMAIIWISSHLDTGLELLYTTSLFLTSHVLQLMVTLIALSFAYLIRDNVKTDKSEQFPKDKETDYLTKIDAIV